jgi:DNA-directed RNA polymerase delta subunit
MTKNKLGSLEKSVEKRANTGFLSALEIILEVLPERTREIIKMRYGIGFDDVKTLEEIGRKYGITRERIRQILKDSFKKVSKNREHPVFVAIQNEIEFTVSQKSGIIKESELIFSLGGSESDEKRALLLFLELSEIVNIMEGGHFAERVIIHKSFDLSKRKQVEEQVIIMLKDYGNTLEKEQLYRIYSGNVAEPKVEYQEFFDYLEPSRLIRKNSFEKWGLHSWNQINPRVTWERAYLILKEGNQPLHFRDIAKLIDKHGLAKKKAHPQTVHNELIRNEKFVLIGRGIYALAEWGYKTGTVKEIIDEILKKNAKPMQRDEILKQMFKMRKVKKSTVLINLNNFFVRTGNDQYFVKR